MTWWHTAQAGVDAALHGMAQPWVVGLALALMTLLLEDVAIAAGVAVATQGHLSWGWAFTAVAGGIALGDLALYGLGLAAHQVPWLQRKYLDERSRWAHGQLAQRLPSAVLLARVVPGLRLVTYSACGFLRLPFLPFSAWVTVAVLLWTAGLFWLSAAAGEVLATWLNLPVAVAVTLPLLVLALAVPLVHHLRARHARSLS